MLCERLADLAASTTSGRPAGHGPPGAAPASGIAADLGERHQPPSSWLVGLTDLGLRCDAPSTAALICGLSWVRIAVRPTCSFCTHERNIWRRAEQREE